MRHWSGRKYVLDWTAITVEVKCHYKPRVRFPKNLVLLFEDSDTINYTLRVYLTEGPRTQNYLEFTVSYQVIFDTGNVPSVASAKPIQTSKVAVCSILTTMQPAVITSLAIMFKREYLTAFSTVQTDTF